MNDASDFLVIDKNDTSEFLVITLETHALEHHVQLESLRKHSEKFVQRYRSICSTFFPTFVDDPQRTFVSETSIMKRRSFEESPWSQHSMHF